MSTVGVGALLIITYILHYDSVNKNNGYESTSHNFQNWFIDNGGWMTPSINLEKLEEYGNSLKFKKVSPKKMKVSHMEKIVETPLKLVFTRDRAMKELESVISAEKYKKMLQVIGKYFFDSYLEQHDTWIAIHLQLECSKGAKSFWFPYLELLPKDCPRLSSFNEKEYSFLQDDDLAEFGRNQRAVYVSVWNEGIQQALEEVANVSSERTVNCFSIDSFHRFVSLVASRAMILTQKSAQPKKYLTPMADMINHANKNDLSPSSISQFNLYHQIQKKNNSITVFADRPFKLGDMIVEEYGKLDNSLYLTAFGFIPENNPWHCVMLPLPHQNDSINSEECVLRDGSLSNNLELEQSLALNILSPNLCTTREECWNHPKRKSRMQSFWKSAAKKKLDASPTSLQEDRRLLEDFLEESKEEKSIPDGVNVNHVLLALSFRIEEKKLLLHLSR